MSSFHHEDKIKANISYWFLFKKLWPYLRKNLFLFVTAVLAVLILALVSRLIPEYFGKIIDQGFIAKDMKFVFWGAIYYLVLKVIYTLLQFTHLFLFQKLGNRVLYQLREDLTKHTQNLPLSFFQKNPTGRIVTRLSNDVSQVSDLFNEGVVSVFTEVVVLIAIIAFMLNISVSLTLLTLSFTPIFLAASFKVSNWIRATQRESKKKLSELNSFVAENLNGIKIIQLYRRNRKSENRFLQHSNEYAKLSYKSIQQYAMLMPVVNFYTGITIALSLYLGGQSALRGEIALGTLVAFLLHAQDFIPPLREILEKYQQFQNSLTSAERIFQLFDEIPEPILEGKNYQRLQQGIFVKNLSFQYAEHLPMVLQNLNFEIPYGKSLAIIGKTGSGKSTLISLLMRFYQVPKQSILFDNQWIEDINISSLRQNVGLVQQDPFLFRGRILDNITLGEDSIDEFKVVEACQKIGYLGLLKSGGRSLDTMVEEKGSNLSTGEKQLIAFARVLVFNPDVLILDEATANVDSITELVIQKATEEIIKGRTSIIIAHRLSTIENCDSILVLDHGQMLEMGSPAELVANKGAYYQLLNSGHNDVDKATSLELLDA